MFFVRSKKIVLVAGSLLTVGLLSFFIFSHEEKIDYNTQVKPILNAKCITCHGGVKAKAGFSLLFREDAMKPAKSGKYPIVPGKPGESEMIKRINASDPDERMPYKHAPLSKEEIAILKTWIKQGAQWGEHWAFVPVKKTTVPDYNESWIKNNVDRFIFEKLEKENLTPAAEADKGTLLRRVSLDITGLPPADSVAKKFLNDHSDKAYESLVEDLLASPAYGERWTALWMDLARYADTRGYEADRSRNIWRYRDWVIKAFNNDQPYNEFLTEQMAGDLMPNPDDAKFIATSFHRNSMTNDEGGSDNEEFRIAATMDRVNTTWSAVMGTTFNCVQCHSHPYDPFKHEEYYKFLAYFNNSRDEDTQSDYPVLRQFDSADSLKLAQLSDWLKKTVSEEESRSWYMLLKTWQPTIYSLQCDQFVNGAQISSWYAGLRNNGTCRLKNVTLQDKKQIIFRYTSNYNSGIWSVYLDSLNGPLLKSIPLANTKGAWDIATTEIPDITGKHTLYFKYYSPAIKTLDETGVMFDWFHFGDDFPGRGKPGFDSAYRHFNALMKANTDETPVMIENKQEQFRKSYVFERGNWMVHGEEVEPGTPHIMNPLPANAPKNRLGLAMWLTDKKNPLTARTMVNRLWEQLFGFGLVETLEDMGTQGMSPTHKELLDYLSWQFMNDDKWSVKKLLKEMVMSATYRQDSKTTDELTKKDPYNKLYARGPRIRLSAEQLRDQGLAVSNLLSKKMYGKSVMPFQPEGIWLSPYNGDKWELSTGEDQYRRALYTYWKRSAPYPSMIGFDGATREVCTTRRIRTNTPLQALTTLNDSAYLVMARGLAYRMQELGGAGIQKQVQKGYETMLYKNISDKKLQALVALYDASISSLKNNKEATCAMIGVDKDNTPETAALVVVANAMLNMDEWVNKN